MRSKDEMTQSAGWSLKERIAPPPHTNPGPHPLEKHLRFWYGLLARQAACPPPSLVPATRLALDGPKSQLPGKNKGQEECPHSVEFIARLLFALLGDVGRKTRPRLARKQNIASEVGPTLQDAFFFPTLREASARQHQARCSAQTGRCKLVCASCSTQVALCKLRKNSPPPPIPTPLEKRLRFWYGLLARQAACPPSSLVLATRLALDGPKF